MPQKPLAPEVIEKARELRSEGKTMLQVATELGISQGSASNVTRDIAKPVRRPEKRKEAPKPLTPTKAIAGLEERVVPGETTIEAINRAREAEADTRKVRAEVERQAALDELEERRQQRQRLNDLELKAREAAIKETEARAKLATSPSPEMTFQLEQARSETVRLERELTEQKHMQLMGELQRGFQAQIGMLAKRLDDTRQVGLGAYDIMAKSLDKAENLAVMVTDKVDRLVKSGQGDKQLMLGLQLGLSPAEFQILQRGEEPVPEYEDFILGRKYRAHRDGVPYVEPEEGEYEGLVSLIQQRNRHWQAVMDKAQAAMGHGGSQVAMGHGGSQVTGKPGTVPAPGEPEPLVLRAESRLVQCTRCGTSFDIDLVEAKRSAALGKRLYVHCANPKCNFLLEITEMIPELKPAPVADKSTKPECYVAGEGGRCANPYKGLESYQCQDCQWSGDTIRRISYE